MRMTVLANGHLPSTSPPVGSRGPHSWNEQLRYKNIRHGGDFLHDHNLNTKDQCKPGSAVASWEFRIPPEFHQCSLCQMYNFILWLPYGLASHNIYFRVKYLRWIENCWGRRVFLEYLFHLKMFPLALCLIPSSPSPFLFLPYLTQVRGDKRHSRTVA